MVVAIETGLNGQAPEQLLARNRERDKLASSFNSDHPQNRSPCDFDFFTDYLDSTNLRHRYEIIPSLTEDSPNR